jgi:hypothetical protein
MPLIFPTSSHKKSQKSHSFPKKLIKPISQNKKPNKKESFIK